VLWRPELAEIKGDTPSVREQILASRGRDSWGNSGGVAKSHSEVTLGQGPGFPCFAVRVDGLYRDWMRQFLLC